MQRAIICAILLLFISVRGTPFTPGNLVITYASYSTSSTSDTTARSAFLEELTTDGTSVQLIDISTSCVMTSNQYAGAPRLSTDGQHVAVPCYVPSASSSDVLQLRSAVGVFDHNGNFDTSTQFNMTSGKRWYRAFKHGDSVYVAGAGLTGHTPYGAADAVVNLTPSIGVVQEAMVYNNNLYALNFVSNTWGVALIGTGTPTTTNQTISEFWAHSFVVYPDTINFFEKDGEQYAYLSQELPNGIWKVKYENGAWVKKYQVPSQELLSPLVSSQIYYENGDGTTTVLFVTDKKIYKTIDDGAAFSDLTLLATWPDVIIKGIDWAPKQIAAPVAPPVDTPVGAPVAAPIDAPIDTPINAPIDAPIDTPVDTPIDTPIDAPMAVPVFTPTTTPASEPVSEPVYEPLTEPDSKVPVFETVPLSLEAPVSNVPPVVVEAPEPSGGNAPQESAISPAESAEVEGTLLLLALVLQVLADM